MAAVPAHKLRIDHVTIVIMENQAFDDIIGNGRAPYINKFAATNVLFTNYYAITHPSQPNYLAIYSGSTQGVTNDTCPVNFSSPSLGGEILHANKSIKGYMEDLPGVGSTVCQSGEYARKHNPLADFSDTPPQSVVPYTQIGSDLASNTYPTVAFVIPNLIHDMHDGSVATGDKWLAINLPAIIAYDARHNGVLFLTWDEDDRGSGNHIATIAAGPMLKPGNDDQHISHYSVLRTVTNQFGLPPLNDTPAINLMSP